LSDYPKEKLFLVSPNANQYCNSKIKNRINLQSYPVKELINTRFHKIYYSLFYGFQAIKTKVSEKVPIYLKQPIQEFKPEAVLTVAVLGEWLQAAEISKYLKIPLHLIIHDDFHFEYFWISFVKRWGQKKFGEVYKSAQTCFCVSEEMEKKYYKQYQRRGIVLLPYRGKKTKMFSRKTLKKNKSSLIIVYAGSLYGEAFEKIQKIGALLKKQNHQLVVFSGQKPLNTKFEDTVWWRKPVSSNKLITWLNKKADICLLYQNFSKDFRKQGQTLFPTKLVDYNASATPVVIVAPKKTAIAKYCLKRPGSSFLISNSSPHKVFRAIIKLGSNLIKQKKMISRSVFFGREDFCFKKAKKVFYQALLQNKQ